LTADVTTNTMVNLL